jgi:DNA-binding MarR family transcriptional regulator/GNAT superfamily N-acetyltransferase
MREAIGQVRRFNRFYTGQIGVVSEHLLRSEYSLAEARVLYELAHRERPTASQIAGSLRLDRGYLSRILRRFQKNGLVARTKSGEDARARFLALTPKGRRTMAALEARSDEEVSALLRRMPVLARQRLTSAMRAIEEALVPQDSKAPFLLRDPRPGDLGWIVSRHGALYSQEYRYDWRFEALVAQIVGEFVARHDPKRERCWVAEKDGEVAGSVFLVRSSPKIAKLRLLYVEPNARGHGVGARLIDECIRFARQAGYRRLSLWTQSELLAARRLYEKAGFARVKSVPHQSFGRDDLVAETWELKL